MHRCIRWIGWLAYQPTLIPYLHIHKPIIIHTYIHAYTNTHIHTHTNPDTRYLSAGCLPQHRDARAFDSAQREISIGNKGGNTGSKGGQKSTSSSRFGLPFGGYSLLGAPLLCRAHRQLSCPLSVQALRMTEVLEWALEEGAQAQADKAGQSTLPPKRAGVLGLFGLGGSKEEPPKDKEGNTDGEGGIMEQGSGLVCASQRELLRLRVTLCPHKLQLAQVLADFGLLRPALAYASHAKAVRTHSLSTHTICTYAQRHNLPAVCLRKRTPCPSHTTLTY